MIRTNPRPTSEWKTRFYDPAFNGLSEKMGREFIYAPEPDRLPSYRRLLRLIMSRVSPGSRLLDVGAASCVFTGMARDAGFDAVACDYSDDALAYGEGIIRYQPFNHLLKISIQKMQVSMLLRFSIPSSIYPTHWQY